MTMINQQVKSQMLSIILEDFYCQKASGTLTVKVDLPGGSGQKTYYLFFNEGAIVYGDSVVLNSQDFTEKLLKKLNPGISNAALDFVSQKVTNPNSFQEIIERLIKIRVLNSEKVISFIQGQIVQILEKILPLPGELEFNPGVVFDLQFDENNEQFSLPRLMEEVSLRQKQWNTLAPNIPSVNGIPFVPINMLDKITEPAVKQHLQKWVDGKRNLGDIAEKLDKDSLIIAKSYLGWQQKNWITFDKSLSTANPNLPTILAVDDSPIVQTSIKRILSNRYNLLLASNAVDALDLLNKHQVSLLLLDLTMPDIDGLEVCKTLRSIPKFRELPIVMLTARDGLVDKLKGQIAGTNRYLTKPFDEEKLLSVVREFIIFGNR